MWLYVRNDYTKTYLCFAKDTIKQVGKNAFNFNYENTILVIVEVCQREDNCRNVGILFKVKVATGFSKQASSNAGLKIPESWLKLVLHCQQKYKQKIK